MEKNTRIQEIKCRNPSPATSPNSNGGSGVGQQVPPLTPIPISRSHETNPYPTTFVQADTTNFKQVVQLLTGSSETAKQALKPPQDPSQTPPQPPQATKNFIPPKKQSFKLYERRNNSSFKSTSLMINTFSFLSSNNSMNNCSGISPRKPDILSPSILDFPKLTLSPVTPLTEDPFNKSSPSTGNYSSSEEDKAIAEKGYYLHPSPMSTPRDCEPQLLPLFPVTSPRVSDQ